MRCFVCNSDSIKTLYRSHDSVNVTSSCQIIKHKINIYLCEECSHIQASPLANIDAFYKNLYAINQKSEPEDQLLYIKDGRKIFKSDYEADVFLRKNLTSNVTRILDYGAAKGLTLSKICQKTGATPYVFDITNTYEKYWEKFFPEGNASSFRIPDNWYSSFDIVTSFFVFEHVVNVHEAISDIFNLLKRDGIFYFQVPNFEDNLIDLMVSDHVQHYTEESIKLLLRKSGFVVLEVDKSTQSGSFIVSAKKKYDSKLKQDFPTKEEVNRVNILAEKYLSTLRQAVCQARNYIESTKKPIGILGAGFYGTYLYQQLDKNFVSFFVDNNYHIKENCGIRCYMPEKIPEKYKDCSLILAVNPLHSKKILSSMPSYFCSSNDIVEVFSL